ncbi:helix-turn-helix domain-containing protein [Umezawaea tangerina]|uniref:DNA-binding IclR family transcriptional regulator n=1 Tax=Umezawaea tangerina TaxID=84725 RepID=A0A2T0T809_9PSEU|nr:helix-turn-helix domain-containing protein [Umezawaea tangerina]PRY41799.1 DNA-binding IclR family transcriptional regulator [Umezawaea tangerina]
MTMSIEADKGRIGDLAQDGYPKLSMLGKALAILCMFEPTGSTLSLTELARRARLSKPTAHRLIGELVQWGLLERHGRELRLGRRLSVLGSRVPTHRVLCDVAAPLLARLHDTTGGRAYLSVRDGETAVHLARHSKARPGHFAGVNPDRIAANAAAKAIKAFERPGYPLRAVPRPDDGSHLNRIRSLGHSSVEYDTPAERIVGVSCPVLVPGVGVVAAMSVVGPASSCPVGIVVPAVRGAATALARTLGETGEFGYMR